MIKILIIEDNKANLDLMVYLFEKAQYSIITAMDGEAGIASVKQDKPDLIICDIQLPKLDGYEIIKILKNDAELKHIPIVAVTAYAMVGDRDKIREAGFDGYLAKPIDPSRFVNQIEALLPATLRSNRQLNFPAIPKKHPALNPVGKSRMALVVDSFLASTEISRILLESIGFEVIAVQSVKDAISAIQKKIPDLILSDFDLPDMSGLSFLRLIRENEVWKTIPFIITSAMHLTKENLDELKMLHVNRFILLPIDSADFLRIIEGVCPATNSNE